MLPPSQPLPLPRTPHPSPFEIVARKFGGGGGDASSLRHGLRWIMSSYMAMLVRLTRRLAPWICAAPNTSASQADWVFCQVHAFHCSEQRSSRKKPSQPAADVINWTLAYDEITIRDSSLASYWTPVKSKRHYNVGASPFIQKKKTNLNLRSRLQCGGIESSACASTVQDIELTF
jgi:hypothetical protein